MLNFLHVIMIFASLFHEEKFFFFFKKNSNSIQKVKSLKTPSHICCFPLPQQINLEEIFHRREPFISLPINESVLTCYNLNTDQFSINEIGHLYHQESNVNNNFLLIENRVDSEFPF